MSPSIDIVQHGIYRIPFHFMITEGLPICPLMRWFEVDHVTSHHFCLGFFSRLEEPLWVCLPAYLSLNPVGLFIITRDSPGPALCPSSFFTLSPFVVHSSRLHSISHSIPAYLP